MNQCNFIVDRKTAIMLATCKIGGAPCQGKQQQREKKGLICIFFHETYASTLEERVMNEQAIKQVMRIEGQEVQLTKFHWTMVCLKIIKVQCPCKDGVKPGPKQYLSSGIN